MPYLSKGRCTVSEQSTLEVDSQEKVHGGRNLNIGLTRTQTQILTTRAWATDSRTGTASSLYFTTSPSGIIKIRKYG